MDEALLENLLEWLRIPSISTGEGEPADLRRAAEFVVRLVREAGGEADVVTIGEGNPLAVGELRAGDPGAPTVLIYGHYDVQSVGPLEAWTTPPFEPQIRDGRLCGRGTSDDKGNFLPLLHTACTLASAGELAVHVRVLVEGEEEAGGESVAAWVQADERGADAVIVFDSGMEDPQTPAITVGLRGMLAAHITVTAQPRDLHSGMYGGSVLNALHVLHAALAHVLPGPDGRVREELRAGVAPVSAAELEAWERLPDGDAILAEVGARPLYPAAGAEFRTRNGAEPSIELDWVQGGAPRTVIPARAGAFVTMRLAPRQDPVEMRAQLEALLRTALPDGAELEISWQMGAPALFEPELPAIRLAADAIDRATGLRTAFVRTGGSIPVVAEFADRGIPVIVTGFGLADDDIHAPDESYRLESLELGLKASREMLLAFADLPRG